MKPDQEEKDPNLDEERQQYSAYAAATCRKERQQEPTARTDSKDRQQRPARQWVTVPFSQI